MDNLNMADPSNACPETLLASPGELDVVRTSISRWANASPFTELHDLGSHIQLDSVCDKPSWAVVAQTFYERRSLGTQRSPGKAQLRRIVEDVACDVRQQAAVVCEAFTDHREQRALEGTAHTIRCDSCNGQGQSDCPDCHGAGTNHCHSCNGQGEYSCSHCDGSGQIKCHNCNGLGQERCSYCASTGRDGPNHQGGNCRFCGGRGWRPCPECQMGFVPCSHCHSRGVIRCTTCNGTGQSRCTRCKGKGTVSCPDCQGCGSVIDTTTCVYQFSTAQTEQVLHHKDISAAAVGKAFVDTLKSADNALCIVTTLALNTEALPQFAAHPALQQACREVLHKQQAHEPVEISGAAEMLAIQRRRLTVFRQSIVEVRYRYNDSSYVLYLIGNQVVASDSPIAKAKAHAQELALLNKKHAACATAVSATSGGLFLTILFTGLAALVAAVAHLLLVKAGFRFDGPALFLHLKHILTLTADGDISTYLWISGAVFGLLGVAAGVNGNPDQKGLGAILGLIVGGLCALALAWVLLGLSWAAVWLVSDIFRVLFFDIAVFGLGLAIVISKRKNLMAKLVELGKLDEALGKTPKSIPPNQLWLFLPVLMACLVMLVLGAKFQNFPGVQENGQSASATSTIKDEQRALLGRWEVVHDTMQKKKPAATEPAPQLEIKASTMVFTNQGESTTHTYVLDDDGLIVFSGDPDNTLKIIKVQKNILILQDLSGEETLTLTRIK